MAATADVMKALFARVKAFGAAQSLPVAYPEPATTFVPPADGKYLSVTFIQNRPRWEGLSSGRIDQGLLQVDVFWPKGQGLPAPSAIADALVSYFTGQRLYSGSARVKIAGEPWASEPLIEINQVRLPVTIPWTA